MHIFYERTTPVKFQINTRIQSLSDVHREVFHHIGVESSTCIADYSIDFHNFIHKLYVTTTGSTAITATIQMQDTLLS